ncbi:hypothetical protein ACN6K5_003503 [Streptomyces violaceoruber]|uniref:hypothetical protein n=1 Tax=Streptomyces violaceoruber TaxID=1935 RepID=UPI00403D2A1F
MSADDLSLKDLRNELHRLVAISDSAERPKPTVIYSGDHSMAGWEWVLREQAHPYTQREYVWVIRAVDEQDTADGLVHVSSPESMFPGQDFVPMYSTDARRLAMALLAAADRADSVSRGVTSLAARRTQKTDAPEREQMT